jgi:Terminase large subunit, T4likevirus-type, N-terminal/Terminase RNaseH-like domain
MPTIQLELVRCHAGQQQVLDEARRFNTLACGRQFGKTTLAEQLEVKAALAGKACAWFTPTYKTQDLAWESLKETLRQLITDTSEQARRIQIRGGGSAECWSLIDPDSGRGRQYDLVVVDEAGQVPALQHAWEQSIRPMLAARRGSAWFLSTPTGTAHYFHVLFRRGQQLLHHDWRSWQMPTSANPHIPREEIEAMRADMSEQAFAQEVLAEFITWEGAVFTRLREAIKAQGEGPAAVIGVDWAGASGAGDFTAFVVLSAAGDVLEMVRLRGESFLVQRGRLKGIWERHGRPPVLAEENGMGAVQNAELRQAGMNVQDWITTNASKTEMVSRLVQAFEQQLVRIPNDEVLLGELQAFQATPLPGGQFRYSAPPGLHDDLVMALAIAYQGLGRARKQIESRDAFRELAFVNEALATGSAWREEQNPDVVGWAERARVMRERWKN